MTGRRAVLLDTTPFAAVPAGIVKVTLNVNGPGPGDPSSRLMLVVYCVTVMLSSGLGAVSVGFFRLLRSVTQTDVVAVRSPRFETTLLTGVAPLTENRSTLRKTNALPL